MVSHPCLFVFAVFGLRSTIAGEVKCNISFDGRNAVLDCHIPCEAPTVIDFLKWTKNNSILALWNRTIYTHTNRTGFRQPWNPSSQDISLQINNPTKEDSGEYKYFVLSECEIFRGSIHLEIPDMKTTSPAQKEWDNDLITPSQVQYIESEKVTDDTEDSICSPVLFVVGILIALFVLAIIILWKKKKFHFHTLHQKRLNLKAICQRKANPLGNSTECRVEEGLLQTMQGKDAYFGEIPSNEA